MTIVPSSLLSKNSFPGAPLAEATNFGFRLRRKAQTIACAVEETGQLQADRQRRDVAPKMERTEALVAFDAKGRTVETFLNTGIVWMFRLRPCADGTVAFVTNFGRWPLA